VLNFRRRYFEAFQPLGLLAPDSDPVVAKGAPEAPTNAYVRKLENQAVRWASYEAFCLSPQIIDFVEAFLGGTAYLHKRKMMRRTHPGSSWSTPAHYDLTYLRGGTDQSLITLWIPIGDIPVAMGGLIYLAGSDAVGRKMEADFRVKNADLPPEERISAYNKNMAEGGWITDDLPVLADKIDSRWLVADYEAGDVVIHSPYMIHAATTNQDAEWRMRLSTDIRYQLVDEPIDERWRHDWHQDDNL
jgi:ectoine hydroxylase-related dioxygenase (phytanoyl-CoA dioxygenase family)